MGIAREQIRWNGWGWISQPDGLEQRDNIWRWLARELGMPALLATPARALDTCVLPKPRLAADLLQQFRDTLGAARVQQGDFQRAFHAGGRSYGDLLRRRAGDLSAAPDAVLYPRDEDEVRAILIFAAAHDIGLVPFGGGTGTPHTKPGCVALDLSGMDRMQHLDAPGQSVTVQAGITSAALQGELTPLGFGVGVLAQGAEFATLGGCIASGASGTDDWLHSARMVTTDGILDSREAGNLKSIITGSQGILGIITEARVKLRPATPIVARAFLFDDFLCGVAAIRESLAAQIPHAMLSLGDGEETGFAREFARLENPPGVLARMGDAWTMMRHVQGKAALLVAGFSQPAHLRQFTALARKNFGTDLGATPALRWHKAHLAAPYRRDAFLERGLGMESLWVRAHWAALPVLHSAVKIALDKAMRENAPRAGAQGLVFARIAHASADSADIEFSLLFPRLLEDDIAQWDAIRGAASAVLHAHGASLLGALPDGGLERKILRGIKKALDPENILSPGRLPPGD